MSIVMGQRIHAKREEYGLSREELAEMLGVSRQTIYQWEAGKVKNIDRDYISRMAKMWNCDPDWLMHMEDSPKVTVTYKTPGREPVTTVTLLCSAMSLFTAFIYFQCNFSATHKQIKRAVNKREFTALFYDKVLRNKMIIAYFFINYNKKIPT